MKMMSGSARAATGKAGRARFAGIISPKAVATAEACHLRGRRYRAATPGKQPATNMGHGAFSRATLKKTAMEFAKPPFQADDSYWQPLPHKESSNDLHALVFRGRHPARRFRGGALMASVERDATPPVTPSFADRAVAYLLERQSGAGGFCFYRWEHVDEPNLSDTWHAVAVLRGLLRRAVPDAGRHIGFVGGLDVTPWPISLHDRVHTLDLLDGTDPKAGSVRAFVSSLPVRVPAMEHAPGLSHALESLRATLWLKRRFGMTIRADSLVHGLRRLEREGGGFGEPANLLDTAMAIAVLRLCGHGVSPRTAEFVMRLAVPGFGFRLTERTHSPNLETTCAGVVSCERLGMAIPYSDASKSFILSCQTGSGGFARSAGALPSFELTHMAMESLRILHGPL